MSSIFNNPLLMDSSIWFDTMEPGLVHCINQGVTIKLEGDILLRHVISLNDIFEKNKFSKREFCNNF